MIVVIAICSAVKAKVIQQHLEGRGRNEIARELGRFHISTGSVSNILKAYKCGTADFTGLGIPKKVSEFRLDCLVVRCGIYPGPILIEPIVGKPITKHTILAMQRPLA